MAFGIPLYMVVHMVRHFEKHSRNSDGDRFVARRVADELQLTDEQARDAIRDVAQGGGYPFLVNAFQTPYFFWEGIDMLRKLALVATEATWCSSRAPATRLLVQSWTA